MKYLLYLLLFLPLLAAAQSGDMRVYTVAGQLTTSSILGDGGPATSAHLGSTEGVWLDGKCNLYFTDLGNLRIRKVNSITGIITTVAGTGVGGFSGDGGLATNARIKPYGLFCDVDGNLLIADAGNNRIRKVDALTGIITTIAGGGATLGDGDNATNSQLLDPTNVYQDISGNIYVAERARIRKINKLTGIISTIVGTGVLGFSGDMGLATNAQVTGPSGMLLDGTGNLIFADRGNHRIRKINLTTSIIATVAGTTDGYSGDGGPATNAQLSGPISFVLDRYDNIIIGDNQNNYLRKIDALSGVITTIAGMGPSGAGITTEGALATEAHIHPEFIYLDLSGNLYFSNYGWQIRKITNLAPALPYNHNMCGSTGILDVVDDDGFFSIYPNPLEGAILTVRKKGVCNGNFCVYDNLGRKLLEQQLSSETSYLNLGALNAGFYLLTYKNCDYTKNKYLIKI